MVKSTILLGSLARAWNIQYIEILFVLQECSIRIQFACNALPRLSMAGVCVEKIYENVYRFGTPDTIRSSRQVELLPDC